MAIDFKHVGDNELDSLICKWLEWDQYEPTRKQIKDLASRNEVAELRKLLLGRIKFGTAGIRSRMEAGNTRLNDLIVIQTCQGLVRFLLSAEQSKLNQQLVLSQGVLIGYDGRHNSARFAQRAATVFKLAGIAVRLFSKPVSTPFVPFGVRRLPTVAGLMVTASHNPKQDNGVKLYLSNGAQIIEPNDALIQAQIEANLEPWNGCWSLEHKFSCPLSELFPQYMQLMKESIFCKELLSDKETLSKVRFAYTSLHGVGHPYITAAFQAIGLELGKHVFPVPEQQEIDPEFSTVQFPNPEEGAGVLDLSKKIAKQHDCQIIIANDPDTDRCCIAERQPNGEYRQLTGNEIGALLGWWAWHKHKQHADSNKQQHCYMLYSTVSSHILKQMADIEGFNCKETLTGFKWMGNVADNLMRKDQNTKVLFAFEEAIGYMCNIAILDKDGISAAVELAQLCLYVYQKQKMLYQFLFDEVYIKYGYHYNVNSYYLCYEPEVTKRIFQRIFNYKTASNDSIHNQYPSQFGSYTVTRVVDLTNGYDSEKLDRKPELPTSASSFMITFYFKQQNAWITLRTSGTEPKIKYYSEIFSMPNDKNYAVIEKMLNDLVDHVTKECLQPELNKLTSPSK